MPHRKDLTQPGYYHIYNRGNNKKFIFNLDIDYLHFLRRIKQYQKRYSITIVCYCLMPNHFHLCLKAEVPSSISEFIKQVQMTHAQHMQHQHGLVGHLYQGRFKAKHVKTKHHLLYLSAYIHANPRSAGIVFSLDEWKWSSYLDYAGLRSGTISDKKILLSHFNSPEHYKSWVDKVAEEKIERRAAGVV
jgi:REP element-mobilizing transposase RayT